MLTGCPNDLGSFAMPIEFTPLRIGQHWPTVEKSHRGNAEYHAADLEYGDEILMSLEMGEQSEPAVGMSAPVLLRPSIVD